MIYPRQNSIIFWFFSSYVRWIVGKQFHQLVFDPIPTDENRSILLVANHFSFWDALILFCVNERLFKKKFHVMILEETAKKEPFLRYAGAFSVSKNSRDLLLSLDYAAGLLNDPGNLVLMFPQGKLYSNFVSHIDFEKGVYRIIKQSQANSQLMFVATFIQYFKHKKPTAPVYLKKETVDYAHQPAADLQNAYQQYYNGCKQQQTEIEI